MCPQVTLGSLKESLEGSCAALGIVMCGHVWSCVVVCLLVMPGIMVFYDQFRNRLKHRSRMYQKSRQNTASSASGSVTHKCLVVT